jgi:hypothetical protein
MTRPYRRRQRCVYLNRNSRFVWFSSDADFTLADDFTVTGPGWNVSSLDFYGCQTGATGITFTAATWSIISSSHVNTGPVLVSGRTAVTSEVNFTNKVCAISLRLSACFSKEKESRWSEGRRLSAVRGAVTTTPSGRTAARAADPRSASGNTAIAGLRFRVAPPTTSNGGGDDNALTIYPDHPVGAAQD